MITGVNNMELRLLSLYTRGYDKELYIREAGRLLEVSSRTALVTLAKLEKKGVLESRTRGKIKTYAIKKSTLAREYFLLAEQYKRILFLEKNQLVKEVLEKAEAFSTGILAIFGSYAKEKQKAGSDLDVFIVGKFDEEKIKDVGRRYGIDINIKKYPKSIFEKKINDDILLKEVVENHVLIKGAEGFVRSVKQWTR